MRTRSFEELAALGHYVCPDCVGEDGLPVRLHMVESARPGVRYATCTRCETEYVSQDGRAAEPAAD